MALTLLLVFGWMGQSMACHPDACVSVEKYVSTNGLNGDYVRNSVTAFDQTTGFPLTASVPGVSNIPATTVSIPTDYIGDTTKVVYKFVVKNCGKIKLINVRLGDCVDTKSVGADGFLYGEAYQCDWDPLLLSESTSIASGLEPGESVTVYSTQFPNSPISSVDVCETFGKHRTDGMVRNNAFVMADTDVNDDGDGDGTTYFKDLNLVKCQYYQPAPAKLGDRVWHDLDGNGIQDCRDANNNGMIGDPGDTGAECGAGIAGVAVNLVDCRTPSSVIESTRTDANGFYMFENLAAGQHCVRFDETTIPASVCATGAAHFTMQNRGQDPAFDSDADPTTPNTGLASAVTLMSGETNRTVDAGVICKACPVSVDKKCQIAQPPPTSGFVCSDAKPIDSLTMTWTGQDGIYIKAWQGTPGTNLLATKGPIAKGEKVTVAGMAGTPNNQTWEIFSGLPDPGSTKIGESQFHISCSDSEMNGPEDCGKMQGNNKLDDATLINLWKFEGMAGNGQTLACTATSQTGLDACAFVAGPAPSCQSVGSRPKSLTFRYTGNDCGASKNSQASDKWFCSGSIGTNPVVAVVEDPARINVDAKGALNVGDLVTVTALGSDIGTVMQLQVGGQLVSVHTSCSQPLAVGDVFGSLELVQFNGQGSGPEVTYSYEVKNGGDAPVEVTSVFDNRLGELLTQTKKLEAGAAFTLTKDAVISQTTTNEVTATARLAGSTAVCGEARDQVTVTVTKPTCNVAMSFKSLSDDAVKFTVKNTSSIVATLDTFVLYFPYGYGAIKEIKLDGSIFKMSHSAPAVVSGETIGANRWTNRDVTKRQLDPGETRTLEVLFTRKTHGNGGNFGFVTFKEGCQGTMYDNSGILEPD